jgi:hypothetical protein
MLNELFEQIKANHAAGFIASANVIGDLIAEIERLRARLARRAIECHYCGAVMAADDAQAQRTHWRDCPQHPAREVLLRLEQENAKLQADRDYWADQARLLHDTVVAQLEEIENS